ncbi:MAG TPA: SAM-dependent methyltransferase [Aggregatilineales bacterium]|nr:50S rRNA methyltransferase [Anaerolineales bacterium]HRE46298.1 SAM-dependent methyltransferase [Aggregatilineales bacterium]
MPNANRILLTAQPESLRYALHELRRIAPNAHPETGRADLAPGVIVVDMGAVSFATLTKTWSVTPPIFPRHIVPVDLQFSVNGRMADIATIRGGITSLIPHIMVETPVSVQTRVFGEGLPYAPFDINNALADIIRAERGAAIDVRNPDQILSVAVAGVPGQFSAWVGLSRATENLSDWAGGMRRFSREAGQISRAEFKLLEACKIFGIAPQARGLALDLGAAPGGWTRILRTAGMYVTAVDPADMHPSFKTDRDTRHLRMTTQAYLQREGDTYDWIVNDMRMDAMDSANLMVALAPQLRHEGVALMTLKLPEDDRIEDLISAAFKHLEQVYVIRGARQLFHNRSEITVWLGRR